MADIYIQRFFRTDYFYLNQQDGSFKKSGRCFNALQVPEADTADLDNDLLRIIRD